MNRPQMTPAPLRRRPRAPHDAAWRNDGTVTRYTMPVDRSDPLSFDFAATVPVLDTLACVWLVPDADVVFERGSDIDFSVSRHRVHKVPASEVTNAESVLRAFDVDAGF